MPTLGIGLLVAAFGLYVGAVFSLIARNGRVFAAAKTRDDILSSARRLVPEDFAVVASVGLAVAGSALWQSEFVSAMVLAGGYAVLVAIVWLAQRVVHPHYDARFWDRVDRTKRGLVK